MPSSRSLLREYFGQVADLPCWHVTAEFGSWLSLHFGQPRLEVREANPNSRALALRRRAVHVVGDYLLWIEMGAWELHQSGCAAFHSEQSRAKLRRAAGCLDGQKVVAVRVSGRSTEITFDFGSVLRVNPTSGAEPDETLWHMYARDNCLSLSADGKFEYGPSTAPPAKRILVAGSVAYAA